MISRARQLKKQAGAATATASLASVVQLAEPFQPLFKPARYKIFYGGRGAAKSWSFARALVLICATTRKRVLCAREYQSSIADSVHRLLVDQIETLGLKHFFKVTKNSIEGVYSGSEFLFKGLRRNVSEVKSMEGVDICWVEEGQSVSEDSWNILIPTIRNPSSEIWVSFNPDDPEGATQKRFVSNPIPGSYVIKVGWQDNPWFPKVLNDEREYMLEIDPEAYSWIWDGNCRVISDAVVFKGRYTVAEFTAPEDTRFYYGVDWGFANDPTVLIRCFIKDERLYVDQEIAATRIELDELPDVLNAMPMVNYWQIKADSSRPETISFMQRKGFNIDGAAKWDGSVKDGIAYLKGFRKIVIHPRCKNLIQEAQLYSYKVDRSGLVLPVLVDRHNHSWDALRYALDEYITRSSSEGVFALLGQV